MGKMKRFLATLLVATMLIGNNGISYAAEIPGGTDEVAQETEVAEAESEAETDVAAESDQEEAQDASVENSASDSKQEETEAVEEDAQEVKEEAVEEPASEDEQTTEAAKDESEEAPASQSDGQDADDAAEEGRTEVSDTAETVEPAASEEEETFEAGELVYPGEDYGKDYTVKLSYDADAKIPAGAELRVREIEKDTEEYNSYLESTQSAVEKGVADARFFDITIVAKKDGEEVEVQPQAQVRVNISYKEAIEVAAEDNGEIQAIHFDEEKEEPDVLDVETDDNEEVSEVEFKAESFSVYGVVYTVDFTYDGYTFSIPGEGSILLSALAEQLNLGEKGFSIENVKDVTFSNNELLKIEKQDGGDWLLTSLKAFTSEETLTILMADGSKFLIVVTDAQDALTVDVNLYDYGDAQTIDFPGDFGGTDNVYAVVWVANRVGDGLDSNITGVDNGTPWAVVDISSIKGHTSPYEFSANTFNTSDQPQWDRIIAYTGLDSDQKSRLLVRVIHTSRSKDEITLDRLKQWSNGSDSQREEYEKLWNGGFDAYAMSSAHPSKQLAEGQYEVNFIKGNTLEHDVTLQFDPADAKGAIPGQKYYVKLDATSKDGNKHYFYFVELNADGTTDKVQLPIVGNWSEGQQYSDNWKSITATVVVPKAGETITPGGEKNENKYITAAVIGDYDYEFVERKSEVDETLHINHDEFVFKLTKSKYDAAKKPKDTLGDDGVEFGVIAGTYSQTGHTETNFAVKTLNTYNNSNIDIDGSGDNPIPFYAGKVGDGQLWLSDGTKCPVDLYITKADDDAGKIKITDDDVTKIYQDQSSINSYVDGLISTGTGSSNTYKGKIGTAATFVPEFDPNYKIIDLLQFPDDITIYVDCSKVDLSRTGWEINKRPKQTVIFNIPDSSPTISKFYVNVYDDNDEPIKYKDKNGNEFTKVDSNTKELNGDPVYNKVVDDVILEHIVFNAYNASTLELSAGPAGLFLAPNATKVKQESGSGAGWILTNGEVESKGEWHFYRHERHYKSKGDFTLGGRKRIMEGTTEKEYSEFSSMTFTFDLFECVEDGTIAEDAKVLETVTASNEEGSYGKFSFSKLAYSQTDVPKGTSKTFYYVIKEQVPPEGGGSVKYDAAPVYVKVDATDDGSGNISFVISTRTKKSDGSWSEWKEIQPDVTDTDKVYAIGNFDNTYEEQKGSLKIRKAVTENSGAPTSDAAKRALATKYDFTIYTNADCTTPYMENGQAKTVSITIGANCAEVTSEEVTNLPAGDYWIKETKPTNGSSPVSEVVKVTVEAGKTGADARVAKFTNNYETVSAQVKKEWKGRNNLPDSLKVTLYADDAATTHIVTLTASNNWQSDLITGLPKYKMGDNGQKVEIRYHWVEGTVPSGFFLTNVGTEGALTTLTNTYQEFSLATSYIGTKTWNSTTKPDSLTVTLYRTTTKPEEGKDVTWTAVEGVTPTWTGTDTNNWTYTFSNLPVFDADGNVYYYKAEETLPADSGYTQDSKTTTNTSYTQGTAELGVIHPCSEQTIDISGAQTDLGFAVIQKGHDFLIWTHRVPLKSELDKILTEAHNAYSQFKGQATYINGIGSFNTANGRVTTSNENGKLTITFGDTSTWANLAVGHFKGAQYNAGTTAFVNTRTATKSITLSGIKTIDKRDFKQGDTATFKIEAVTDGAPLPMPATVTINPTSGENQTFSFNAINYNLTHLGGQNSKTFEYKVTESACTMAGVTKDISEKKVKITVTDVGTNELSVVKESVSDELKFENKYSASGTATVQVSKNLVGKDMVANAFTFTLEPVDDAPMPDEATALTATNDENGKVEFANLQYTLDNAGKHYVYKITETDIDQEKAPNVVQDTTGGPSAIYAKVTVGADKKDGTLEDSTVAYYKDAACTVPLSTPEFVNKYTATGSAIIKGKKVLEGGNLTEGQFTFKLQDEAGNDILDSNGNAITATNKANGSVEFPAITYSLADMTYDAQTNAYVETVKTYKVVEDKGTDTTIIYDQTAKEVKVTLKDKGNGTIDAQVTPNKDQIQFTAENKVASINENIKATKSYNNWEATPNLTFEFKLTAGNNTAEGGIATPMPAGASEGTITKNATKDVPVVDFGSIKYTAPGTYNYKIQETDGKVPGVTYDLVEHSVVVTVTRDKDTNELTAEVKYDGESGLTITNNYATAKANIQVTKNYKGDTDWGKAQSFEFTLKAGGNNAKVQVPTPMPDGAKNGELKAYATKDNKGLASFGEITYEELGEYDYTITETNGKVDGVTYDTTAYPVKVTVYKDNNGNKATKVEYGTKKESSLTIENTFTAAKANFEAEKSFNAWGKANSFTFVLEAGTSTIGDTTGTSPMPAGTTDGKETKTVTKGEGTDNPKAVFSEIEYDKAGTYEYTITELDDHVDGVSYDTTPHKATVVVTKDPNTNALSANVTYGEGEKVTDSLTITNTFTAVKANFEAEKSFNAWGKANSFTFVLEAGTSTIGDTTGTSPMPAGTTDGKETKTVTKGEGTGNPKAVFSDIEYDKAGTYEYTITELDDHVDGVSYDITPHKATVVVTKDPNTNALSANVTYGEGEKATDSLTIENTFTAAKAHFEAEKSFNAWDKANSFTFVLEAGTSTIGDTTGTSPMPAGTTDGKETKTVTKGEGTDNPKAVFSEIEYDKAGTYNYTITEVNGGVDGVSYDAVEKEGKQVPQTHNVVVTVTKADDATNKLTATVKYDGGDSLTITNTFTSVKEHIEAAKVFEGRDWADIDEFEFELAAVTDGAPMPEKTTLKATKDKQTVVFGDMEFVKAGNYVYTVTEKKGTNKGITYDTDPHTVTVKVTKAEDATNELTAAVEYGKEGKLEIKNTYAAEGHIVLEAQKELKGETGRALRPEQFSFELYEGSNLLQTKQNSAEGKVTFDEITYTKPGTYDYTIKEKVETKPGYTFDSNEKKVTVTVTDNLDGTLTAKAEYDGGSALFTNTYEARGSVSLKAHKTLENRKLDDKQFIFELYNENGVKTQTVYNDSKGNVTFSSIGYKKPGTYKYTIKELVQNKKGYTFDTSVKNVVVTVTDLDKGILAVEVKYDGSDEIPEFINKYDASVKVSKTDVANGKELEGAKIQIIDKDGKVVAEWTSTKKAHEVTGLKTGETYTLHEEVAPDGYTIAADTKFTIDESGKVTSTGTITKDGVLLVEDSMTSVKVSKVDVADGKELEGAKIQILDKDGKVVSEWTSGKEAHEVKGLKTGEKYTLHEEVAPNGYTIAADTTFTIDENGKVTSTGTITEGGVMLIEDAMTEIKVSKVDVANGKELEGAKIQILDDKGKVVAEWTSGKQPHVVKGLKTGVKYTLHEVVAPNGYEITADTTFTIDKYGNVTSSGTITKDGVLLIEDAKKEEHHKKPKKKDSTNTGDEAPLGVLFGGLGIGAVGLAVLLEERRRRSKKS